MEIKIYYFSGTGNSLSIARQLGRKWENAQVVSILETVDCDFVPAGDVMGIVCPIYMYNIPHIVVDFIKKITDSHYVFMVFAGGGELGGGIRATQKLFKSRGITLSSLFNIPMPSNYTPYGYTPEDKQKDYFDQVEGRIEDIVNIVNSKQVFIEKRRTGFFKTHVHPGLLYKLGYKYINTMDKSFTVDDNCSGCSICQKVCPVGNVTMINNRPVWNNQCQQCYACLQWCPETAIQSGKRTVGIKRYHHPNISVKDIIRPRSGS